jgi:spermidine synthase
MVNGAVAFASGALVFACEVVFVHLLVLIVGTSAYAFGVILSIFLVCLFLGATLAPLAHRLLGSMALALGLALAALALAGTLGIWQSLPDHFRGVGDRVTTFEGREIVRGTAAFIALFLPTTLMGLSFPLLLQSVAKRRDVGRVVGRLTAINTVGSVVGSLATGYWILPALGSQRSIVAVASTFALAAVLVAVTASDASRGSPSKKTRALRYVSAALAALAILVGVLRPPWDLAKLTGGYNVYFDWGRGEETIVSVAEDTQGGVTTVTEKDGVHTLLTNGKFQGNDGAEMHAQRFFAHYPLMFTKRFDRALVIGLGTGTTLGTVASYPFEHVEVAEISPAIVTASKTYFHDQGGAALDDPRVTLFMEDGRNHLLTSSATYDLIGIELTSVWFAGAASLYSHEFYQLVKKRLAPDGVLQQWVQLHHIYPRDLATVVHTLRLEFAHVALFYGGGQGILVASNAPLVASKAHLDALEASLGDKRPSRGLSTLTVDVLATESGLDAFVADAARESGIPVESMVSTDDNLYLEYATPRGNVLGWASREDMVKRLGAHYEQAAVSAMIVP